MTGVRCCVASCQNSHIKTKESGRKVMYHSFPKDSELCKIWVEKCGRGGEWNPRSCHICSEHFPKREYQRDLQAELLNYPQRPKLNRTAIPSLNLCAKETNIEQRGRKSRVQNRKSNTSVNELPVASENSRKSRAEKRKKNALVNELPVASKSSTIDETVQIVEEQNAPLENGNNEDGFSNYLDTKKQLHESGERIIELRSKITCLEKELAQAKTDLDKESSHRRKLELTLTRLSNNKTT